jgi:hypothetical protein
MICTSLRARRIVEGATTILNGQIKLLGKGEGKQHEKESDISSN